MTTYNWKQFIKRITVHAEPQTIFNSWATQDGLETWFLRLAEFKTPAGMPRQRKELIQKGDRYKWLWFGYDDTFAEEGEILFSNDKNELQFSFSGGCIVKMTIKKEAGETICELQQSMPMDDEAQQRYFFIECGKGWTFYMTNLKSILEGGIDLRNKNEKIQNVINA
ncbi:MAG: SRPBCC domain-containing protein [Chitinophagales bacterium]